MAKPDPREDSYERRWNREMIIVVALVGLFILVGAIYTLINGPPPPPGGRDTRPYVAEEPVPSPAAPAAR